MELYGNKTLAGADALCLSLFSFVFALAGVAMLLTKHPVSAFTGFPRWFDLMGRRGVHRWLGRMGRLWRDRMGAPGLTCLFSVTKPFHFLRTTLFFSDLYPLPGDYAEFLNFHLDSTA